VSLINSLVFGSKKIEKFLNCLGTEIMKIFNAAYLRKFICTVALFGVLAGPAIALPIMGSLEYSGALSPMDGPGGNITTLGNADYLDFFATSGTTIGDGAFSSLTGIGTLSLNDFWIDPFSSPTLVWTSLVGTAPFTFTLTSMLTTVQNDNFLTLTGSGYFSDLTNTLSDTAAVWSLSAQDVGTPSRILTFSASTASVPEPNALMLLGLGLTMFGVVTLLRRRA